MDSNALKKLMSDHGWSVNDVATIVERDPKTVYRWQNGPTPFPNWAMKLLVQHAQKTVNNADQQENNSAALLEKTSMPESTHPHLEEYVAELAGNPHNGIDGLAVLGFNVVTKELELLYKSGLALCHETRRPKKDISEEDLIKRVEAQAEDVVGPNGAGKVSNIIIGNAEVAIIQLHDRDISEGYADIFAWINYKGDNSPKLRRSALRVNITASDVYRKDEGL